MTRKGVLVRSRLVGWTGPAPARPLGRMILGLILATVATSAPCARGAGIFRGLSETDRSHPILLDQAGDPISLRSPGHGLAPGSVPAYLAFALHGGEDFPAGTPTVAAGPQPGVAAVGPLELTPTSQGQLNADLMTSRGALVSTPDRSYAVDFLPRYARALAHSATTATPAAAGAVGIGSILGLDNPKANWTINGIPASQLSRWFQTGTSEIAHLTSMGVDRVSKTLGVTITPTNSGYHIAAAQELIPPPSTPANGGVPLAVPAPEPSAWLVFALILVAAGLWRRPG